MIRVDLDVPNRDLLLESIHVTGINTVAHWIEHLVDFKNISSFFKFFLVMFNVLEE